MRYLTDTEILKWSNRLENSSLSFVPVFSNITGHPDINIVRKYGSSLIGFKEEYNLTETDISYQLSFSVTKNRVEDFFSLFDRLWNNGFHTQLIVSDGSNYNSTSPKTRSQKIQLSKDVLIKIEEITHTIFNRDFVRYTYNFSGKVQEIIAYVTILEDTINYFSLIWGYDEEGHEHCLVKFPIGSIVSLVEDKSKDYLVIDYNYIFQNNQYEISYRISEILTESKSSIIRYSSPTSAKDENLCFSRNNRIDNILN